MTNQILGGFAMNQNVSQLEKLGWPQGDGSIVKAAALDWLKKLNQDPRDNLPQKWKDALKKLRFIRHFGRHFFFGHAMVDDLQVCIGKPADEDGHILVFGGSGSGKSSCLAVPALQEWPGRFFAIDIKGELLRETASCTAHKHPYKVFNFSRDSRHSGYDPFDLLRTGDQDDLVQHAREIAQAIIPVPSPEGNDTFWCLWAQHILTAILLYVYGLDKNDPNAFNQAMIMIQTTPIAEMVKLLSGSGNEDVIMHINQFTSAVDMNDDKMLYGIGAQLSSHIIPFATDNRIKAAFSPDSKADMMRWEDLETHNIYMQIPEDKIDQWSGAIALMLTQLIRTMERRPDKHSGGENQRKLPPVLLLLDEFPRLGTIRVIQNAVSTLRSKGVTICMMVQSLAQLDLLYGEKARRVIVDNCPYKAILNASDPETQKMLSEMIGSVSVARSTVSFNDVDLNDITACISSQRASLSVSMVQEPIVLPHELAYLKKKYILQTPRGVCWVKKAPYFKEQARREKSRFRLKRGKKSAKQ